MTNLLANTLVNTNDIPQFCIHGSNIDGVDTFKLLEFISSDLSWDYVYITEGCKANALNYLFISCWHSSA